MIDKRLDEMLQQTNPTDDEAGKAVIAKQMNSISKVQNDIKSASKKINKFQNTLEDHEMMFNDILDKINAIEASDKQTKSQQTIK